jgi:hypothetical protein
MYDVVDIIDYSQPIRMNVTSVSDIRIPIDNDDAFLDFYQPHDVSAIGMTNIPNIKKFISPYQENAFTEEVLYEVVNNRLGFVLPYHLWEEINEAFTYYWNEEIGLNGDLFQGTMYIAIREYLTEDLFFCPDELLQEIVTAIEEFIVTIPGVVIQD